MLTTDLVRVRRRGDRIEVPPLRPAERERLLRAAEQYVALAHDHAGRSRRELDEAIAAVPTEATDYRRTQGLRKLLADRCTFEARADVDPRALRRAVFTRAAAVRRELGDEELFPAGDVRAAAAIELGLDPAQVAAALFADLKENHRLVAFDPIAPEALVDAYERGQAQAVLLRAVRVTVELTCPTAAGYRFFFRRLKFHRLLYVLERREDGSYRIDIDGPFSLFSAVTKYGLQLALLLGTLAECGGRWRLEAEVRWGRERLPARFELAGDSRAVPGDGEPPLPAEVARLARAFAKLETPWTAAVADELLDLPGVGLCVPDLVFTHAPSGARVFLEVLGYWSRAAVWRRVELVEAGLGQPVVFAVSSRLRVSEEVLDADLPARLYVYKGLMSAAAILERLEALRILGGEGGPSPRAAPAHPCPGRLPEEL